MMKENEVTEKEAECLCTRCNSNCWNCYYADACDYWNSTSSKVAYLYNGCIVCL